MKKFILLISFIFFALSLSDQSVIYGPIPGGEKRNISGLPNLPMIIVSWYICRQDNLYK